MNFHETLAGPVSVRGNCCEARLIVYESGRARCAQNWDVSHSASGTVSHNFNPKAKLTLAPGEDYPQPCAPEPKQGYQFSPSYSLRRQRGEGGSEREGGQSALPMSISRFHQLRR